jgi:thermitase
MLAPVLAIAVGVIVPVHQAAADPDRPATVRIVVPTSEAPKARAASGGPPQRWVTVEVPLIGTVEETVDAARVDYGEDVTLERIYQLAVNPGDDDLFDQQWHLENNATGADIDALAAWKVADGSGVKVAVIDSGIDASHPDLQGQVIPVWDYIDWDDDPSPVGTDGLAAHGTVIAGLIAAADNDIGVVGVAPGAKILNIRACDSIGCPNVYVANAVYVAVDSGAHIVNLSLGGYDTDDIALEAAIDYARSKNVLVVAAAGNDSIDLDTLKTETGLIMIPAGLSLPNILSVAASDDRDLKAAFSNYGLSVDVFAPGVNMVSTGLGSTYVGGENGTSYAAPVAAGVAALLLSHDPGIGYQELLARIRAFTDKPSTLGGLSAHGRVDAGKVITNRFIDTSATVFHNTIKWLADQKITQGCNPPENHRYCPGDNVTRGQMAVFFARAFKLPNTSNDYFSDDDGTFYENAANKMAAAGITVGCGSGQYCGSREITRGEMAAMLSRVLGLPQSGTNHFVDDNGSTFEGAINRIADAAITQGCNPPDNDRFCPTRNVNRGQMAAFIQRSVNFSG